MDLRSRNRVNASFSMSSMTDLVFLLLIFFIIISTLVSPSALSVDLPESSERHGEKPSVSVTIDARLNHFVNNQLVDIWDLEKALMASFEENDEKKSIIMSVDKTVPAGITVNVIEIAKRNKCKLIIRTQPKAGNL